MVEVEVVILSSSLYEQLIRERKGVVVVASSRQYSVIVVLNNHPLATIHSAKDGFVLPLS